MLEFPLNVEGDHSRTSCGLPLHQFVLGVGGQAYVETEEFPNYRNSQSKSNTKHPGLITIKAINGAIFVIKMSTVSIRDCRRRHLYLLHINRHHNKMQYYLSN